MDGGWRDDVSNGGVLRGTWTKKGFRIQPPANQSLSTIKNPDVASACAQMGTSPLAGTRRSPTGVVWIVEQRDAHSTAMLFLA